ncbi:MAG TPA: DUF4142 domain-containing protein [Steroidobacteraceae bacterium]
MNTRLIPVIAILLQSAAFSAAAQQTPDRTMPPPATGSGASGSQSAAGSARDSSATGSNADRSASAMSTQDFVTKAASDGMAEVELGKLAQQKSKNPEIKNFGAHMVKDHTAANEKLKAAASQANVTVPTAIDAEHRQAMQSLQGLEGTKFDAAYSEHMKADHAKAVALFESASQSTQVAAPVRQFAENTLPTLREHHEQAQELDTSGNMMKDSK